MKKQFIVSLEVCRGIAAVLVAGFHVGHVMVANSDGGVGRLIDHESKDIGEIAYHLLTNGGYGVVVNAPVLFFFVLSGFVLMAALTEKSVSFPEFMARRLTRIYPAAFVSIAAFLLIYTTTGVSLSSPAEFSAASVLQNALLLKASINGVLWTIQAELIGSVVAFCSYLVWRWRGLPALLTLLAALSFMSFSMLWVRLGQFDAAPSRLAFLHAFVFGAAAWVIGRSLGEIHRSKILAICSIALFFASEPLCRWALFPFPGMFSALLRCLCASVFIACLAFGDRGINHAFDRAPLRFLGRVSYSFYLLHPLSLMVIFSNSWIPNDLVSQGVPRWAVASGLLVASTLAVIPLAYLSYRFVELPMIRWARGARFVTPSTEAR
ncbi:acyltransferase family protein [Agrobacterium sp. 22-221-1]